MSVTAAVPTPRLHARRVTTIVVPTTRVATWQPMAAASLGCVTVVALGSPSSVAFRLSMASACLAASAAYLIDDPAAATVAASPTSLPARRLGRAATAMVGAGVGWLAATTVAAQRVDGLTIWPSTVEFATLVAVALAAAAVAAAIGDGTGTAVAGVVVTLGCFASSFLPGPAWLPFPPDLGAPGATHRLVAVLVFAGAVLAFSSRDPARAQTRPGRRSGPTAGVRRARQQGDTT